MVSIVAVDVHVPVCVQLAGPSQNPAASLAIAIVNVPPDEKVSDMDMPRPMKFGRPAAFSDVAFHVPRSGSPPGAAGLSSSEHAAKRASMHVDTSTVRSFRLRGMAVLLTRGSLDRKQQSPVE
jgi:hypothetical protein